jgi:hypothetical protein
MTDDLIKRLRGILSSPRNAWDTFSDTRQVPVAVLTEAAAALEAQAKRIAELESSLRKANADTERYERCYYLESDRAEKAEADLAAARADISDLLDWVEDLGGDSSAWKAAARGEAPIPIARCCTCAKYVEVDDECVDPLAEECFSTRKHWEPRSEILPSTDAFLREMAAMADEECPTCDGKGGHWVGDREYWECPDCGTGKKEKTDVCPTCEGSGYISMGNGMYPDCYDCGGTGKKEVG